MSAKGDRFAVVHLSPDYGERCYGVEDHSIVRDNLVREWRKRGPGRTTVEGIAKPKKGMIWRGTEHEAIKLCEALNKANKLGSMSVASDPPTRANTVAFAKERNSRGASGRTATRAVQQAAFVFCDKCKRMVKESHSCA